jgi:hypothetical protein
MVLFRPLGRWRPTSFSGVFRRRRLAADMASDAERHTTGTYLLYFVFWGSFCFCAGTSVSSRLRSRLLRLYRVIYGKYMYYFFTGIEWTSFVA